MNTGCRLFLLGLRDASFPSGILLVGYSFFLFSESPPFFSSLTTYHGRAVAKVTICGMERFVDTEGNHAHPESRPSVNRAWYLECGISLFIAYETVRLLSPAWILPNHRFAEYNVRQ